MSKRENIAIQSAPKLEVVINERISQDQFEFVQLDAAIFDQKFEGKPISFMMDAWLRFKKNKTSVVAGIIILFLILMAIFAPMFARYHFREQHVSYGILPPRIPVLENFGIADGTVVLDIYENDMEDYGEAVKEIVEEYSWEYKGRTVNMLKVRLDMYEYKDAKDHYFLFGTDNIGRDCYVRLWRGTRISLIIGICSVLINCIIGVVYGSVSGYYGGKVDMVMQRVIEVIGGIPFLVMAIMFVMFLGAGIASFILVLIITGWIGMSRMIRAQFYRFKGYEYVLAARTMGVKDAGLIFRHILPNAIGPIITQATFAVPSAIFAESFLSYLGLGIQAPEPSIGVLLAEGQQTLTTSPHLTLFPALVVCALMLAFNLFGNGLRDAFDPKMRGL